MTVIPSFPRPDSPEAVAERRALRRWHYLTIFILFVVIEIQIKFFWIIYTSYPFLFFRLTPVQGVIFLLGTFFVFYMPVMIYILWTNSTIGRGTVPVRTVILCIVLIALGFFEVLIGFNYYEIDYINTKNDEYVFFDFSISSYVMNKINGATDLLLLILILLFIIAKKKYVGARGLIILHFLICLSIVHYPHKTYGIVLLMM